MLFTSPKMKNYVLNMSGHECAGISAHEISELFHQGAIERDTPCRRERSSIWKRWTKFFRS
jgi:hypothetical protein